MIAKLLQDNTKKRLFYFCNISYFYKIKSSDHHLLNEALIGLKLGGLGVQFVSFVSSFTVYKSSNNKLVLKVIDHSSLVNKDSSFSTSSDSYFYVVKV
jgi:hypothetical protein